MADDVELPPLSEEMREHISDMNAETLRLVRELPGPPKPSPAVDPPCPECGRRT